MLFIFIGILSGTDGFGGIYFDNFYIAQYVGVVALSFILFMGGLSVRIKDIKPIIGKGLSLGVFGVLITALIVGYFSYYFLNFSKLECMLLGAIVSSTDAAAVFSVLRSKSIGLKEHFKPLLEFESGSNDPMAVFLTIGIIGLITGSIKSYSGLIPLFISEMTLGIILGFVIAKIAIHIINTIKLEYEGLYYVISIATVLLGYSFASKIGGNGFMCVYIIGLTMAAHNFVHKQALIKFHDGIAWLMQITMFLVLGLLVFVKEVAVVAVPALFVALLLVFVARPISVFLSLAPFKTSLRDMAMISWVGLRGAAPSVLATFPLLSDIPHSHDIYNVVFFVVLVSVLLQGTTISAVAKFLKVDTLVAKSYDSLLEYDAGNTNNQIMEFRVPENSIAAGKQVFELKLPEGSLLAMILREEEYIVPCGSTIIQPHDVLFVLMDKSFEGAVREAICTRTI